MPEWLNTPALPVGLSAAWHGRLVHASHGRLARAETQCLHGRGDPATHRQDARATRALGAIGLAMLLGTLATGRALAAGALPQPASQPASMAATLSPPGPIIPLPIVPSATVEEALALTPEERAILADVADRTGQLDEAGLYVMLRRAAMLPPGPAALDQADEVAAANLLSFPSQYRAHLVRFDLRLWRVEEWKSDRLTFTRWWGRRSVWRLDCTDRRTGEPLILLLTRPPEGLAAGDHAEGPRVRSAGLFYKTVRLLKDRPAEGGPASREYPVLVGAQVASAAGAETPMPPAMWALFALVALLAVAFVAIRILVRRRPGRRPAYRPLRNEPDPPEPQTSEPPADEELARQLREYQAQHPKDSRP